MSNTNTFTLSERFEVAFNQIHDVLKKIVRIENDKFRVLLDVGAKRHQMVKKYYNHLQQYAKLRNSLVHAKTELGFYIAEPHQEVVEHIESISELFARPNQALSIATKSVKYFNIEDRMDHVFKVIKEYGYSQYPVYQGKKCIGLLKAADIVKWMSEHVINTSVNVSDIKVRNLLSSVQEHPIEFASKSINIFSIEEIYENKHKQKIDLEAIIITENGLPTEKPLGLITAWDLIQLDYDER